MVLYEGPETFTLSIGSDSKTVTINDIFTTGITEPTLFTDNGHYYQFVTFDESFYVGTEIGVPPTLPTTILWQSAIDLAATYTHNGIQGHLATITSAEENEFVRNIVGDNHAYLGAHDSDEQGVFTWVTGPEAGLTVTETGYTNWWPGEPSNNGFGGEPSFSGEDALAISNGDKWNGQWWDGPKYLTGGTTNYGFLVEYSAPPPPAPSRVEVWDKDGITQYFDSDGDGKFETDFNDSPYRVTLVFDDPIYIPGTDEFDLTFNDLYFDFITAENGSFGEFENQQLEFISGVNVYHFDEHGNVTSSSQWSGGNVDEINFLYTPPTSSEISEDAISIYLSQSSFGVADAPSFEISVEDPSRETPALPPRNIHEFNGHFYEVVVSQPPPWDTDTSNIDSTLDAGTHQDALNAASQLTHNGLQGHLVTITSAEENQFITSLLTDHSLTPEGNYYTAGSDRDNEGTFVWIDGPEAGEDIESGYTN